MPTPAAKLARLLEQSPFVFRGRVLQRGASNVRQISAEPHTAMIAVDEVLHGNALMRGLAGRQITAVFDAKSPRVPDADGAATFFATGLVYGESVAVRVVDHTEATPEVARQVVNLSQEAALRPLKERAKSAGVIITGRVVGLHAIEARTAPPSEHDPEWWIADVLVLSVVRGREDRSQVEVLFASSIDIAWYKAPKLHAGQSALLLLHAVDATQAPAGIRNRVYQIIDPDDLQPVDGLDQVKQMIAKPRRG